MGFSLNTQLIFDALGWAVLHSLWQGALAGLLVWGVRKATHEQAADTRYMFGFLTLCALLTAFVATFLYTYFTGANLAALGTESGAIINLTRTGTIADISNPLMRLTKYTNFIGALWALCFAGLGVRALSAYRLTHTLRTTGLSDLPSNWQNRFSALSQESGVTGAVRGFISEHVSSPITFGFFKPIVLVPAWFFTGLSTEQCEAILLHEFAHIRRHDYVTNIVQIIIKTVFFYHPAIAYICKSINEDREHACDDFATRICKKPEELAMALGTIRIKSARSAGMFALSADAPDTPLMHRLKRLVGTPNKTERSGSSQSTAAAIMMITVSAAILSLGASDSFAHPQKTDTILAGGIDDQPLDEAVSIGNARIVLGDKNRSETISVQGEVYTSGANGNDNRTFTISSPNGDPILIDGKPYSGKYEYSIFSKQGKSFVVKTKNEKRYIEIDGGWHKVNGKHKVKTSVSRTKANTVTNWINGDAQTFSQPPAVPEAPETPDTLNQSLNLSIQTQVETAVEAALRAEGRALSRTKEKRVWEEATQEQREQRAQRREAALERAEEARERKFELRKAARERAKDARERKRNAQERLRDKMERKREAKERSKDRKHANAQRAQYQDMRDRLLPLLKADGYLPKKSSKVTIDMTKDDIFINRQQLPNAKEGQYCNIISDYIPRKDGTKHIVIKPGYLHVSVNSRHGNSNYTFNEN